jgi:hypothetical protein
MSLRLLLAASAALALAAPALAQEAPAAPPAAATGADAEAAFEARAEAFGARMEAMGAEMQTAVTDAAGDRVRAGAALDVVVARYQPEADAFADELVAFIASQMANAPEEQRVQMTMLGPVIATEVKGAPGKARDEALAAMDAAAAPAATE